MPCLGGLDELLSAGIGQGPNQSHQIAAVGPTQALKRSGRSLQLSPRGVGHLQDLFPPRRQRLAARGDVAGRSQGRDRRIEFLCIIADVGLRLRRWRTPWRGIAALGHGLQKTHRSSLTEQVEVLHDRQAGKDGRLGDRRGGPPHGDPGEKRRQHDRRAGQPLPYGWPCRGLCGPAAAGSHGSAACPGHHLPRGHGRHLDGGGHHVGGGRGGGQHIEQFPDLSECE